jgi:L-amino acid N-acyltransferase YncA
VTIRQATAADKQDVVRLSNHFWATTIYTEEQEDEQVEMMFDLCLSHGLLSVLVVEGNVVGFAAGLASPLLAVGSVKTGVEVAFWIEPEYRGRNGLKLMRHLTQAAQNAGVKYWNMVSMESSMDCGPLYEKEGYVKAETNYCKVLCD